MSPSVSLVYYFFMMVLFVTIAVGERAYPQGCSGRDPSYYDDERTKFVLPNVKNVDDFVLTRLLGTGKFSDVFEAVYGSKYVVLKCLKPVSERKFRREILVLKQCEALPNLVRLMGVVLHETTEEFAMPRMPTLVLQHAGMKSQWLCHMDDEYLSEYEMRYFLCHLLVALDNLHKAGIMHRDVKPRNVLINRNNKNNPLTLIDLGLADFFRPNTVYNVRVASRHYKSPELLVNYTKYDYSIDLWGVGCILAGLLLRRQPFFRGKDNLDQLYKIICILGVNDLLQFLKKYNIPLTDDIHSQVTKAQKKFASDPNKREALLQCRDDDCPMPTSTSMDLLEKLLVYDPDERLTAAQAIQHPFFDLVRDRVMAETERNAV